MRKANLYLGAITIVLGSLILLGVFVTGLELSTDNLPGPGFLPFWLSLGIILMGVLILIGALRKKVKMDTEDKGEVESSEEENPFNKEEFYNFAVIIGSGIGVVVLTPFLGLITALGLAVGAMTRLFGEKNWVNVILVAVGSSVVFYIVFSLLLNVPLPVGPLNF